MKKFLLILIFVLLPFFAQAQPTGDADADGVQNPVDNCPTVSNTNQADTDSDGIGDACEDSDGDGIIDRWDNCPSVANPDQRDSDYDIKGDACDTSLDTDRDRDGVLNSVDNCPAVKNPDQKDTDGDLEGDICDDSPNGKSPSGEDADPGSSDSPFTGDGDGDPGSADRPGVSINIDNPLKAKSLRALITMVIKLLIQLAIPVAVVIIIYSGFLFVTARGDEAQIKKARLTLTYAVIGLAILLASSIIAEIVENTITSIRG